MQIARLLQSDRGTKHSPRSQRPITRDARGKRSAHFAGIIVQRLCPRPGFLLSRLWLVLFWLGRSRSRSGGDATHGRGRQGAHSFLRHKCGRCVHRRWWCVLRRRRPAQGAEHRPGGRHVDIAEFLQNETQHDATRHRPPPSAFVNNNDEKRCQEGKEW